MKISTYAVISLIALLLVVLLGGCGGGEGSLNGAADDIATTTTKHARMEDNFMMHNRGPMRHPQIVSQECPSPSVYTSGVNACVYPMYVWAPVSLPKNELDNCILATDACWTTALANGTVIVTATTATDNSGKQVDFVVFRNNAIFNFGNGLVVQGFWDIDPMFAATGVPYSGIQSGTAGSFSIVGAYGNAIGVIVAIKDDATSVVTCSQEGFQMKPGSLNVWDFIETTCPAGVPVS
jgi:hypothetical protein